MDVINPSSRSCNSNRSTYMDPNGCNALKTQVTNSKWCRRWCAMITFSKTLKNLSLKRWRNQLNRLSWTWRQPIVSLNFNRRPPLCGANLCVEHLCLSKFQPPSTSVWSQSLCGATSVWSNREDGIESESKVAMCQTPRESQTRSPDYLKKPSMKKRSTRSTSIKRFIRNIKIGSASVWIWEYGWNVARGICWKPGRSGIKSSGSSGHQRTFRFNQEQWKLRAPKNVSSASKDSVCCRTNSASNRWADSHA